MHRLLFALPFLAVPLAAAACGGSKSALVSTTALSDDPLAAVKGAARKTAAAGSEHMKLAGAATASGQSVTFKGAGDFDSKNKLGSMTVDFSTGGLNGTIDEISDGTDVYIKSDLLSIMLPEGKTWIKVDLTKTAKSTGVGISSFLSQDPAQALTRLLSVQSVTKVGDVQLDGAPATLYRGRIDLAKAPAGAAATGTGRYQVWIGEDGYVHRVKAIVHSSGTISTVTSDLSAFGEPVSVDVPSAAETFDGSNSKIPGLGG